MCSGYQRLVFASSFNSYNFQTKKMITFFFGNNSRRLLIDFLTYAKIVSIQCEKKSIRVV